MTALCHIAVILTQGRFEMSKNAVTVSTPQAEVRLLEVQQKEPIVRREPGLDRRLSLVLSAQGFQNTGQIAVSARQSHVSPIVRLLQRRMRLVPVHSRLQVRQRALMLADGVVCQAKIAVQVVVAVWRRKFPF